MCFSTFLVNKDDHKTVENEMYVIDVATEDEIPTLLQISHILQHEGTWIVCGFVNVVQEYDRECWTVTVSRFALSTLQ